MNWGLPATPERKEYRQSTRHWVPILANLIWTKMQKEFPQNVHEKPNKQSTCFLSMSTGRSGVYAPDGLVCTPDNLDRSTSGADDTHRTVQCVCTGWSSVNTGQSGQKHLRCRRHASDGPMCMHQTVWCMHRTVWCVHRTIWTEGHQKQKYTHRTVRCVLTGRSDVYVKFMSRSKSNQTQSKFDQINSKLDETL